MGRGLVRTIFQVGGGGGGERSKRAIVRGGGGGDLNIIFFFLHLEFRFRNGLGRTLALQSFRISHLINAEILPKAYTMRNKNKVEKNPFNVISTYYIINYNGFQMNYNAFCLCEKNRFKSIFSPICCLSVAWDSIMFTEILDHKNGT